jgi:hypothetical protein
MYYTTVYDCNVKIYNIYPVLFTIGVTSLYNIACNMFAVNKY